MKKVNRYEPKEATCVRLTKTHKDLLTQSSRLNGVSKTRVLEEALNEYFNN